MIEKTSLYERCKNFLNNRYDNSTKLISLLFFRDELNRLEQTPDIVYLKDSITKMIDVLVDD